MLGGARRVRCRTACGRSRTTFATDPRDDRPSTAGVPLLDRPRRRRQSRSPPRSSPPACGRTTCSSTPRGLRRGRAAPADDPYYLTSTMVGMGIAADRGRPPVPGPVGRLARRAAADPRRGRATRRTAPAPPPWCCATCPTATTNCTSSCVAEGFLRIPVSTHLGTRRSTSPTTRSSSPRCPRRPATTSGPTCSRWERRYDVTVVAGGSAEAAALTAADRDAAVPPVPQRARAQPRAQRVPAAAPVLRRDAGPPGLGAGRCSGCTEGRPSPVAFAVQHVGRGPRAAGIRRAGLPVRGLATARTSRRCGRRCASAQRHGVGRVLFGMSADLQKARFGARPRTALGVRAAHRQLPDRRPQPDHRAGQCAGGDVGVPRHRRGG